MQAMPLPPAFPVPQAFVVPEPILAPPQIKPLEWEPVPMYIETTPQDIPTPTPKPNLTETGQTTDQDNKSQESPDASSTSGKPLDIKPPENLVPEMAEVQIVELPIIGVEVPLPRTEILVTATTTAGVSSVVAVGGTLFATTLFRQLQPILKPIFKFILKKLASLRKKPPPRTFARERLLQKRLKAVGLHPGK